MTPLSLRTSLTSALPRTRAQRKSSKADSVPLSMPVVLTFPRVLFLGKHLSKTNNYQLSSHLTISWAQPESTMKSITQGTTPNTLESTCWYKFNDESLWVARLWLLPAFQDTTSLSSHSSAQCTGSTQRAPPPPWPPRSCGRPTGILRQPRVVGWLICCYIRIQDHPFS